MNIGLFLLFRYKMDIFFSYDYKYLFLKCRGHRVSFHFKKRKYGIIYRYVVIAIGIIINITFGLIVNSFLNLPLYLDITGTVFVASVAGLLPAVLTGLLTNVIISFFIPNAFYFAMLSVLAAIVAAYFVRYDKLHNIKGLIFYFIILALLGGNLTTLIHWLLLGEPQYKAVADFAHAITSTASNGVVFYFGVILVNTIIQGIDKSLASAIGFCLARFIPSKIKEDIYNSGWRQKPIPKEEIIASKIEGYRNTLLKKIIVMLVVVASSFVAIISLVSINIYFEDCKEEYSINRSVYTESVGVEDGMNVIFHSMSLPSAKLVWHCPYVVLFSSDDGKIDGPNYRGYALVKLSGENDCDTIYAENFMTNNQSSEFGDWDTWEKKNKEGVECHISFRKKKNSIELAAEDAGIIIRNTTKIKEMPKIVYFALTGDECAITDIRIYK